MKKPYLILRIAHWIFLVFAYLYGVVIFGVVAGVIPLVVGGAAIPLVPGMAGSPTLPARAAGAVSLFVSAPVAFIVFHAIASSLRLLIEIREQVGKP
jgi:hypothetical protein